jgi:hypothetical protein
MRRRPENSVAGRLKEINVQKCLRQRNLKGGWIWLRLLRK